MSEISCDCSTDDYDGPSCSKHVVRKARTNHICCECRGDILPGHRYEYVFGIWDGRVNDYKTCLPCLAIRKRYCPTGWVFGELRDTLMNCLRFDYTGVPGADDEEEAEEIDEEDAANVAAHRRRVA